MENQNLYQKYSVTNKIIVSSFDNNNLAYLDKKFTEMNSELASIYDTSLREENDISDKSNFKL